MVLPANLFQLFPPFGKVQRIRRLFGDQEERVKNNHNFFGAVFCKLHRCHCMTPKYWVKNFMTGGFNP